MISSLAVFEAIDEAIDHLCDRFLLLSEQLMLSLVDQTAPTSDFEQRNAFMHGASRNDEEVLAIRLSEPTIAFVEIRRDR